MPSSYKSQIPTSTTSKIKDSILILSLINTPLYIISVFPIFPFQITKFHYIILNTITITLITLIFLISQPNTSNTIQQVFEANNIKINDQYPLLLSMKEGKSND